jgi:hypothetical protein
MFAGEANIATLDRARTVLLEAESFPQLGGWVIDQQFMDQMGSPMLLAHGLGRPVADAVAEVAFPVAGTYHVWVRTRDWVATWNLPGTPGKFQLLIDGKPLETTFGIEGVDWHWQSGGTVSIADTKTKVALHDLTGFEGRCDAICFSLDDIAPPNRDPEMTAWRRALLGLPDSPAETEQFDLVVVGGGMAGCCTAVSAARLGVKVALIQDRPVLGGNNSSEIRVGLAGLIHQAPYPRLGDLVDEIGPIGYWPHKDAQKNPDTPRSREVFEAIKKDPQKLTHNAGPASNYDDEKKLRVVQSEKNIRVFLNEHLCRVEKDGTAIRAVIARNIADGRETRFTGRWFADCTGDGTLGFLAGADFRVGRECREETGESLAPEKPDGLTMGTSVQWYSEPQDQPSEFPDCPWAVQVTEATVSDHPAGEWDWESGIGKDQIGEAEPIRDLGLRAVYGNWAYLKNQNATKEKYANRQLAWVAYIGGKRESRRLLGDVVLHVQDVVDAKPYPDACVTTTWTIDLHYPQPKQTQHYPGQEYRSVAKHKEIKPYPFPYRCLYSRNVSNLFMAGRDISVTHVALGTVRVMRTCGMMGEVVGMAASLCKKYETDPRDVYEKHLDDLKELLTRGVGK